MLHDTNGSVVVTRLHDLGLPARDRALDASRVEDANFMGDSTWWHDEPSAPTVALTDDGHRVLNGEADHIALAMEQSHGNTTT